MTDPVAFVSVEKQHLVCFRDGLVAAQMPDIDAAIRKHQLSGDCALFRALVPASALAVYVPDDEGRGFQQSLNGSLRHGPHRRCGLFLTAVSASLKAVP